MTYYHTVAIKITHKLENKVSTATCPIKVPGIAVFMDFILKFEYGLMMIYAYVVQHCLHTPACFFSFSYDLSSQEVI